LFNENGDYDEYIDRDNGVEILTKDLEAKKSRSKKDKKDKK
jgi:hypothetical protein